MKKIIALVLMASVSSVWALSVDFGSDNDGLGGWLRDDVRCLRRIDSRRQLARAKARA